MSFEEYNRDLHGVLDKLIQMPEEEAKRLHPSLPRIRKLGKDGKRATAVFDLALLDLAVLASIRAS